MAQRRSNQWPMAVPSSSSRPFFRIDHVVDIFAARRGARELAICLGFDRRAATEIAIAVSELSSVSRSLEDAFFELTEERA